MNEPIWKLMPRSEGQNVDVVWRKWSDGRQESCLVNTPEYLKWVAEGNTPEEADDAAN
jgi:hypothetical protein